MLDLYGAALAHFGFARHRTPGDAEGPRLQPGVRAARLDARRTPSSRWSPTTCRSSSTRTTMELGGARVGHPRAHPPGHARRARRRPATSSRCSRTTPPPRRASWRSRCIHVEIDRHTGTAELKRLRVRLLDVMRQVSAAVEDWPAMRARAHELDRRAAATRPPGSIATRPRRPRRSWPGWTTATSRSSASASTTSCATATTDRLRRVEDSGLGILERGAGPERRRRCDRAGQQRWRATAGPLIVTKANTRSTVHRPAYLDYVGVKRFDADGEVVGERRFLGLYTRAALPRGRPRHPGHPAQGRRR